MNPNNSGNLDRRLDSWASALPATESSGFEARIRRELAASLAPVTPLASPSRLALLFFAVFSLVALALIALLDKAGFHLMSVAQIAAMAGLLALAAILFSFSLAAQIIPAARPLLAPAPLLLFSGAALAGAMALLFSWPMQFAPAKFVEDGWPCAMLVAAVAIPSALLFYLLARRGALFSSASLGALIGALAVILALTAGQFQCMFPQAPHLLIWHGGIAAILIGVSALFGAILQRRAH